MLSDLFAIPLVAASDPFGALLFSSPTSDVSCPVGRHVDGLSGRAHVVVHDGGKVVGVAGCGAQEHGTARSGSGVDAEVLLMMDRLRSRAIDRWRRLTLRPDLQRLDQDSLRGPRKTERRRLPR